MNLPALRAFYRLRNPIKTYAWGSPTAFQQLFGLVHPAGQPQAELWMGAHPSSPSEVETADGWQPLDALIAAHPHACLSAATADRWGELPFLFKVLAAEHALSIQVHPNRAQAAAGFERENTAGIALDAPERQYKDRNHKPELVYALTPFQALQGFRPLSEILAQLQQIDAPVLLPLVRTLAQHPDAGGLAHGFIRLLALDGEEKNQALAGLMACCRRRADDPLLALIAQLAVASPQDMGLFAPLLLNVVNLQPGDAMYLAAGTPHAYLRGCALEIMASSDNVLRAGLTPKYRDLGAVAACTRFQPTPAADLLVTPKDDGSLRCFPTPAQDFALGIFHQPQFQRVTPVSAEIVLALDTSATLIAPDGQPLILARGESAFIPAATGLYWLSASGRVARAAQTFSGPSTGAVCVHTG
ncbi:mannose-6-phosphate isomerase, class I [Pantoea sp. 1.19]|uniref:mannose-6-phosphate isomerase, class I n=1 Tax=Pantoea sp. 1.19 TaxID=1925589 RepID=UPI000948F310|nr:mannose-6-phosphate isomerase, class I [Pantoea sp. 1.19]